VKFLYLIFTTASHFGTKKSSIEATSSRLHPGSFLRSIIVFQLGLFLAISETAQENALAVPAQKVEIFI